MLLPWKYYHKNNFYWSLLKRMTIKIGWKRDAAIISHEDKGVQVQYSPVVSRPHDCHACKKCVEFCPTDAISFEQSETTKKLVPIIHYFDCSRCLNCIKVCPNNVFSKNEVNI